MKRSILLLVLLMLFWPLSAFATGVTSQSHYPLIKVSEVYQRCVVVLVFTADGSASFASSTIAPSSFTDIDPVNGIKGWYLYKVETVPGATGPTNGAWDLDITDANSYVVTRTLVDDRSSTATQEVILSSGYPMILDTWTVSIGDNAVNSAVVTVYLTFVAN
jgi:hypothetical protein